MRMHVLPACMSMHYLCDYCPRRVRWGLRHLGTGVTDDCELEIKPNSSRGAASALNCRAPLQPLVGFWGGYFLFYVCVCFVYMYVHIPYEWLVPTKARKGLLGLVWMDGCESPCGWLELNQGTSTLNHGAIFPASLFCFEDKVSLCSPGWPGTEIM